VYQTQENYFCSPKILGSISINIVIKHRLLYELQTLEEKNMPKSSKQQIDIDEKKVISEIQKNSKEGIGALAKKCGSSRQKIWRIIKRLEENKTIWGYSAIIDDNKIGSQRYFILIKRTSKPFSKEHIDSIIEGMIEQEITKMEITVENVSYTHGDFDWIHIIHSSNILHVKKYCEILINLSKDYISDIKILEDLFPVKQNFIFNPHITNLKDLFFHSGK